MNITVYCGSNFGDDPRFEEAARDLGAWIARAGHTLVYGGSSVGLMGAVSRAAIDGGAPVIGVEPAFFIEAGVAQHDLTELFVTDTMGERKAKMIELGEVFVALPGGVGTLEEISEILTRVRLDLGPHECFLLNIDGFYDPLAAFLLELGNLEVLLALLVLTWCGGFDIIYALQDADFDRAHGLHSIPARFGTRGALHISILLHACSAAALLLFARHCPQGPLLWTGVGVFLLLLALQHVLVTPTRQRRIAIAFGTLNGLASLALALFVIADLLLRA